MSSCQVRENPPYSQHSIHATDIVCIDILDTVTWKCKYYSSELSAAVKSYKKSKTNAYRIQEHK